MGFVAGFCLPSEEEEGEGEEDEDYGNSEAPFAAERGSVATTPVLLNLLPTLVAETYPTSALNHYKPPKSQLHINR